ncbi:hypothetical protein, conserved [Trypanosoma brucei gambiense DAL972]|uniref:CHAT domain-containing protein n=1 Tax=Trypanosoma brucei gambiense (strain MHOM/CI/86/DAL972) TaxID=679716 RepID=D0A520_TRYB9|nr:hypothetical protein, conserved [Trypanosoma brucei gambiense DAL972]CBH16364.1 hypothetical protein, conserved [Trypanosoma brucei gambiense DAL972]|eukprot:XP_011778628.1 hypothetical protein, conserved [Trypanosoma brucei gambiense DAL972]
MNFRKLTKFWRRQTSQVDVVSGSEKCTSGDYCDTFVGLFRGQQGKNFVSSLESGHAALEYIKNVTERGQMTSGTLSSSTDDELEREREEALVALELCVITHPQFVNTDVNSSNIESGESEGVSPSTTEKVAHEAATNTTGEEVTITISETSNGTAAASANTRNGEASTPVAHYTQEERRALLYELVSIMLSIDRFLYINKIREEIQLQHPSMLVTLPPTTTIGTELLETAPSTNATDEKSVDFESDPYVAPPSISSTGRESVPDLASCQSNPGDPDGDISNRSLNRAEEVVARIQAIITWIVLQKVLRSQLELHRERTTQPNSPTIEAGASEAEYVLHFEELWIDTAPLRWEQVVEELKEALGMRRKEIAEAIISSWILNNHAGHELLQCVMLEFCYGANFEHKTAVDVDTTRPEIIFMPAIGSNDSDGQNQSLQQTEALTDTTSEAHGVDDVVPDDMVEKVKKTFKQCIVTPWVCYLEQSLQVFQLEGGNRPGKVLDTTNVSLCCMVSAYAICSKHWEEVKRRDIFHFLEKLWCEQHVSTQVERMKCVSTGTEEDTKPESEEVECVDSCSPPQALDGDSDGTVTVGHCAENDKYAFLCGDEFILPVMLHEAWATVLCIRAHQCLNGAGQPLSEAVRHVRRACSLPIQRFPFWYCQRAHEAIVHAYVAAGNYAGAIEIGRANVNRSERHCATHGHCLASRVNYLESLQLLAEIQAVYPGSTSFTSTVQTVLQQAVLCEQALKDVLPVYINGVASRYAALRRNIYRVKLMVLKLSWRVHYRLAEVTRANMYFHQYIHLLTCRKVPGRLEEQYNAWKERGEQLLGVEHNSAVCFFARAVDCAKKIVSSVSRTAPTVDSAANCACSPVTLPCLAAADATDTVHQEIELNKMEAEGERNLALAYIEQADHEVNVKKRRQQLSNAVNCAYAAQGILHRWTSKLKAVIPSTLMIGVASGIVVTTKALLRLGQPRKAALLLEPLIEERSNSSSVRPPLWTSALEPLGRPLTAGEISERTATMLVRLRACDLHAQCLSKFDGERGYREVERARAFLKELKTWAVSVIAESAVVYPKGEQLMVDSSMYNGILELLREANALHPLLSITCGDSLVSLGKWEEALQEYSDALSIYSAGSEMDGLSNRPGDGINECPFTTDGVMQIQETTRWGKDQDRIKKYFKIKESLVLAKLAEVYVALRKPLTAIHYYRQVLENSTEVGDALLQYNARLHLARLHTATGETDVAAEQWSQVSELAKVYDDEEISRETTRNIIEAQQTRGAYADVIEVARELNNLASAAEGEDALEDRCFALEAIADAHLQLGQYKDCVKLLDEREKVEDKGAQRKGELFNMRARALLGSGATQEAVKVLVKWAQVARQQSKFVELANANASLAAAYATAGQIFKAKRHHQAVLSALAEVPDMKQEQSGTAMESARWLVHQFYLNDEKVPLLDDTRCAREEKRPSAMNDSFFPSSQSVRRYDVVSPCVLSTASGEGSEGEGEENEGDEYFVMSESGDLNVLLQEEEKHARRRLRNRSASHDNCGNSCSSGVYSGSSEGSSEGGNTAMDERFLTDCDNGEELPLNCSMVGADMASVLQQDDTAVHTLGVSRGRDVTNGCGSDEATITEKPVLPSSDLCGLSPSVSPPVSNVSGDAATTNATPVLRGKLADLRAKQTCASVAETYHTDAASEGSHSGGSPVNIQAGDDDGAPTEAPTREFLDRVTTKSPNPAAVHTKCFHRALETIEAATQLALMTVAGRQGTIPRNPADVIDLALISFPHCTFVFYFADFATQHSVIIRPACRSFYLECLVHPYTLNNYHSGGFPPQSQNQQDGHRMIPDENNGATADGSVTSPDSSCKWTSGEHELLQSLHDLHADLWEPVCFLLKRSHCRPDEAECLVFVVDPTLLQVPFPALVGRGDKEIPLGQQYTVLVTPTVVNFLRTMQHNKRPTLFGAPQKDRSAFLPQGVSSQPWIASETTLKTSSQLGSCSFPAQPIPTAQVSVASSMGSVVTARSTVSLLGELRGTSNDHDTEIASRDTSNAGTWTVFSGCTRKELVSAFGSPSCRALMLLCDPVGHKFKVADGMVGLADVIRDNPSLSETLDLVVITNERSTMTSVEEPGTAARLCLQYGYPRVIRVDLPPGTGVTTAHLRLLHAYYEKLSMTLEWRMRYPYALALRMAQEEALRLGFPPTVCASLTLIGAA